ncbi:MAG: mannonate dehydratase [Anaerolineae bacterium]|jgi:mannonate dehydratase
MRLILSARNDDELQYAAQLGCDGIVSSVASAGAPDVFMDRGEMAALVERAAAYGLRVEGFSTPPWVLCYKWMMGLPGRDAQIERLIEAIDDMGAVGIPMQVFNMHALRFYRTSREEPERAGARSTGFDWAEVSEHPLMAGIDLDRIPESHRRPILDEEMWANYAYFLKAALPTAEAVGVRLALHPDDPQVPVIGGVARIMRSPEAMRRALEVVPSPNLGLKFCTGCYAQMGADVAGEIRALGADKIFLVDFRNVRGRVDHFQETFLDNGQEDMAEVMRALVDVGYEGPIGPDHAVRLLGDGPGHERYWAYAIGYMRALLQAVGEA